MMCAAIVARRGRGDPLCSSPVLDEAPPRSDAAGAPVGAAACLTPGACGTPAALAPRRAGAPPRWPPSRWSQSAMAPRRDGAPARWPLGAMPPARWRRAGDRCCARKPSRRTAALLRREPPWRALPRPRPSSVDQQRAVLESSVVVRYISCRCWGAPDRVAHAARADLSRASTSNALGSRWLSWLVPRTARRSDGPGDGPVTRT